MRRRTFMWSDGTLWRYSVEEQAKPNGRWRSTTVGAFQVSVDGLLLGATQAKEWVARLGGLAVEDVVKR